MIDQREIEITEQYHKPLSNIITLFLVLILHPNLIAQGFPCDGTFYYVSTDRSRVSRFYQLRVRESDQTIDYQEIILKSDQPRHITCLGYNVKDRLIYGLDFNTYELLKITPDGTLTSLGVPENLDTTFSYYAGEMTADGRRLMVIARNRNSGLDERVYSIQVNDPPRYLAGFFPIVADIPVAMSDISVDPFLGVTYGFDYQSGQIIVTNRSGQTTVNHSPFPIEKVKEGFGSLFFGKSGQLYGLGSAGRPGGDQSTLYKISKTRGNSESIARVSGGEDTDGCGCPYSIQFYKKINPPEFVGCQEVRIEYIIQNQAGIGQVSTRMSDLLPDILTINQLEIENLFTVKVNSGVGSNFLEIDQWTLVLGENRLTITAQIGAATPDRYGSQAMIYNLPLALDHDNISDDPSTAILNDSTYFQIIDQEDLKLEDFMYSSCDLDTVFLSLPLTGSYQWSDGSSENILPVTDEGWYSVTIESECFTYHDSIEVEMNADPLFLDLGPDQIARLGEQIQLDFTTNAEEIRTIEWSGDENIQLNCTDCEITTFTASRGGSVSLTITDERGCQVSNEVQVSVDETKQIFIPNGFSPNDDGHNDQFKIYGTTGLVKNFSVFDRWGTLIINLKNIDIDDPEAGWDGTKDGVPLPVGVYIWTAEILFPDQITQHFSGATTLIR